MKILVLSSLFPSQRWPYRGIFIKQQLLELKKQCDLTGVIAPVPWWLTFWPFKEQRSFWRRREDEEYLDIKIYRPRYVCIPRISMYLNGFFYYLSTNALLKEMQGLQEFDILHVHFAYPDGLAGVLLAKKYGKRCILTVRGSDINYLAKDLVLGGFIRHTLRNVDGIICVSDDLRKKVCRLGADPMRTEVVPNGIDLNTFRPSSKMAARRRLGLPVKKKIILYVGGLTEVKGPMFLLEAFKRMCYTYDGDKPLLVIIGSGPLEGKIKTFIRNCDVNMEVLVKGGVPHGQVPLWMNASDVLCLPSLNEGRPNVVYEALACGLPTVASNVGGVREILVNENLGQLVQAKQVGQISRAINEAVNREWDRKYIRKYALQHDVARYARKIERVYKKTLY